MSSSNEANSVQSIEALSTEFALLPLTTSQKDVISKAEYLCSMLPTQEETQEAYKPILSIDDFNTYFSLIEQRYQDEAMNLVETDPNMLLKCKEICFTVIDNVDLMKESFSTIKTALSHSQSIARNLRDEVYSIYKEMDSIKEVVSNINAKLGDFSRIMEIKKILETSPKDINVYERMPKIIDFLKDNKDNPEKGYVNIVQMCLDTSVECIMSNIQNDLNNLVEDSLVLEQKNNEDANSDGISKVIEEINSKFISFASKSKCLINKVEEVCANNKKLLNLLKAYRSKYESARIKLMKSDSLDKRLKSIISQNDTLTAVNYIFAYVLLLAAGENHIYMQFFLEDRDVYSLLMNIIPKFVNKLLRSKISSESRIDILSNIYNMIYSYMGLSTGDNLDKIGILEFSNALKPYYLIENFSIKNDETHDNLILNLFPEIDQYVFSHFITSCYKHIDKEISGYRPSQADMSIFFSKLDKIKTLVPEFKDIKDLQEIIKSPKPSSLLSHLQPGIPNPISMLRASSTSDMNKDASQVINTDQLKKMYKNKGTNIIGDGTYYPTVQRSMYIFKNLWNCVGYNELKSNCAVHIINQTCSTFIDYAKVINSTKSHLDSTLFVLSNTLNLFRGICGLNAKSEDQIHIQDKLLKILEKNLNLATSDLIIEFTQSLKGLVGPLISSPLSDINMLLKNIEYRVNEYIPSVFVRVQAQIEDLPVSERIFDIITDKSLNILNSVENTSGNEESLKAIDSAKDSIEKVCRNTHRLLLSCYSQQDGDIKIKDI